MTEYRRGERLGGAQHCADRHVPFTHAPLINTFFLLLQGRVRTFWVLGLLLVSGEGVVVLTGGVLLVAVRQIPHSFGQL